MASLHHQLADVRQSKHQTEEERAESSRVQEAAVLELRERVGQLEREQRRVEERAREREEAAAVAVAACDEARGQLFQVTTPRFTSSTRTSFPFHMWSFSPPHLSPPPSPLSSPILTSSPQGCHCSRYTEN